MDVKPGKAWSSYQVVSRYYLGTYLDTIKIGVMDFCLM